MDGIYPFSDVTLGLFFMPLSKPKSNQSVFKLLNPLKTKNTRGNNLFQIFGIIYSFIFSQCSSGEAFEMWRQSI